MRIGIDVRYLSHGLLGGIHTYLAQLVPVLVNLAAEHEIFLYADTKRPFELQELPRHVTLRRLPWRNGLSTFYLDLRMKRAMGQDHLDLAHFPANYGFAPAGARTLITLHDQINIMPWTEIVSGHPKNLNTIAMMTYLHWCTRSALRRAHFIITVSEYARQQIARHSGFDIRKIMAVPHAPTAGLRRVEDCEALARVRQKYGLTRPFVLADGIKNPAVLVRAWRQLPSDLRNRYAIVFFSRRTDPPAVAVAAAASGLAHVLIQPPRSDLIALYSQAQAFVFPSLLEGFGIPILEAMTCGAPVIASNRGAIPEVAAQAAWLMDAEDDSTLAAYLTQLLTSPEQARRLQTLGFERAAEFSWPNTARRTLECYHRALAPESLSITS
jgi:glycosyltransferase involved in cell wall biosynthesis